MFTTISHIGNSASKSPDWASCNVRSLLHHHRNMLLLLIVHLLHTERIAAKRGRTAPSIKIKRSRSTLLWLRSGAIISTSESEPSSVVRTVYKVDKANRSSRTINDASSLRSGDSAVSSPSDTSDDLTQCSVSLQQQQPTGGSFASLPLRVNVVTPPTTEEQRDPRLIDAAPDAALRVVHALSFLLSLSCSMVALAPAQALHQWMADSSSSSSSSRTSPTMLLSSVTATAALLEIASSRWMGVVALERWGRQPTLTAIVLALTLMHAMTAWQPCIATVCATKFVDLVAIGYFALSVQTILSDLVAMNSCDAADTLRDVGTTPASSRDRSSRMSAAIGTQMALSGVGFLSGMLCAGELASRAKTRGSSGDGIALVYGTSALVGAIAVLLIRLGLPETSISRLQQFPAALSPVVQEAKPRKKTQWWQFLVSCTGLLTRHGNDVRIRC